MDRSNTIIGREILGKYVVEEKIGSGGMATVYKALQKNLDRYVALKIVNENFVDDEELIKRFIREAHDMAKISHPNVVTVYDFGNEGDIYFIAMEYLEGTNLLKLIRQMGRLDESRTLKYIAPIADALNHIHKLDFVHRDVKSSNIFITDSGRPVLMDFGIAYHSDKTISDAKTILGTAEYMSPEQTQGAALDERTDLYSLGIVLYECLTGELPFHGDSLTSTIYKVTSEEPVAPKKLVKTSPWLNELILRLLRKEPAERIETAEELFNILDEGYITGAGRISGKINKVNSKAKVRRTRGKSNLAQTRMIIGALVTLTILLITPVILWALGIFPANQTVVGINGPQQLVADVSDLERQNILTLAGVSFEGGEYEEAHRYLMIIEDKLTDESSRNSLIASRKVIVEKLLHTIPLVAIPGGQFMMGDSNSNGDNSPEHMVRVGAFEISATEITLKQYISFINAFACNKMGYIGDIKVFIPSIVEHVNYTEDGFTLNDGTENLPAYGVTWDGAHYFCTHLGGRLPTEAEWEYVAKSGSGFIYSGGNDPDLVSWNRNNASSVQPVGNKVPNGFGIYDMSGNVWEWCGDYYSENYYQVSVVENPQGPVKEEARVIRGGDVRSNELLLSNTYRSFMYGNKASNDLIGFRLCRNQ
jgi:serine/threonine-protein kinase